MMLRNLATRTIALIPLFLLLFSMVACFSSPSSEPEEPLGTEGLQLNNEHYQPSEDPNYESDKALIMETIEVSDVQADYDVRILRALGIEGIQKLSYEGNSYSSTREIRLVDSAGIEYMLYYTHRDDHNGIGSLERDTKAEDGTITRHILYFGSEKREYLADGWEYYELYNEPR